MSLGPVHRFTLVVSLISLASIAGCTTKTTVVDGSVDGSPTPPAGNPADTQPEGSSGGEGEQPKEPVPFALTSAAFAEGDKLPAEHTCDGPDVSPALSWTAGPEGTKSYAIVFKDESNQLTHAAIYDIPADVTSLPKNVEKKFQPKAPAGAKQPKSFRSTVYGWAGPCPGELHTYAFTIYALGVDALTDTSETTTAKQLEPLIKANDLASTKLTVKYERP